MLLRMRKLTLFIVLLVIAWIGWHMYGYFFDTTEPKLQITGVCDGGYYAADVACAVNGKHRYKIADISVWIDDRPIAQKFRVNKRSFTYPLPICTKTLAEGKHHLKVEVTDGTKRRTTKTQELDFYVDNQPLYAAFVRPQATYKVQQGKTLHLQIQVNKPVKKVVVQSFAHEYKGTTESERSLIYECFIPISCEETPSEYPFGIEIEDFIGNRIHLEGKFQVILFPFKQRRILHVSKEKIEIEKEMGQSQALLESRLADLVTQSQQKKLWSGMFIMPVQQISLSCPFGEIRTTQEKGRYIHTGLDVVAVPRSVVWASQSGIVVLKERYAYSGNTVVIDHGLGIFSLFFHLDNFANINVGDFVKKGNPIGMVGKTGYATGYHLHWEMRVVNIPVDPLQWTKSDF